MFWFSKYFAKGKKENLSLSRLCPLGPLPTSHLSHSMALSLWALASPTSSPFSSSHRRDPMRTRPTRTPFSPPLFGAKARWPLPGRPHRSACLRICSSFYDLAYVCSISHGNIYRFPSMFVTQTTFLFNKMVCFFTADVISLVHGA